MYDFASDEQLPHIQKAIKNGRKAIEIRKQVIAEREGDKNEATGGGGVEGGIDNATEDGDLGVESGEVVGEDDRESKLSTELTGSCGDGRYEGEKLCEDEISQAFEDGSGDMPISPCTEKSFVADSTDESSFRSSEDANGRCKTIHLLEDVDLIYQRHRLGLSLMNLAFNLDSWDGENC